MTVLTSVDTLSGEIDSGTIQAVATKAITRSQLLLGKWLGFIGMLTLYVALMMGGITALTYLMSLRSLGGVAPHHLLRGMSLIWLECVLLLTVTFMFGTSLSTLTNGVLALGMHGLAFIGGWIEQAGALTHSPRAVNVGIAASVLMPSESLWRRAAFEMQSPLVGAVGFSPFSNASVRFALAISANIVRVLDETGVRVRDLPLLTGVSKEAIGMAMGVLRKKRVAVVEAERSGSRTKVARLTPKGREAQDAYRQLLGIIEERWQARFGEETISTLREALGRLVGEPTAQLSPLFRGLEPYPDGRRTSARKPNTLPHYPLVRGLYNDI